MVDLADVDTMTFDDVLEHAARLGRIVYLATTRADGRPHNVPVGVAVFDGLVHAFVMQPAVKVTNVRRDPRVHLHWAVGPDTNNDSLLIEGTAVVLDTTEQRTALWHRMGYDLSEFEPAGPSSDGHVFLQITPIKATLLLGFGFAGRKRWARADATEQADATKKEGDAVDLRGIPERDNQLLD